MGQFGMSDKVGKIYYESRDLEKLSPELQNLINSEIKLLLDESYERASNKLIKHRDKLEILAQALLKEETMTVDQIKERLGYDENSKESPFQSARNSSSSSTNRTTNGNQRFRPRMNDSGTRKSSTPTPNAPVPQI